MIFATSKTRPPPEQNLETIALQLDRWNRAAQAVQEWAEGRDGLPGAKKCTDFAEGKQWEAQDRAAIEGSGRLPITLNKISPLTRLINGYFKQNRYQIKYLPAANGTGNEETAKALNYVAQQVGETNQSKWNDSEVFRDGIYGGRGYFDIRISDKNNAFGEIVESTLDPFSVFPDPEASEYDPKHWQFVQVSHWFSWNDIPVLFSRRTADLLDSRGQGAGRMMVASDWMGSANLDDIGPARWFGQYFTNGFDQGRFAYVGSDVPGVPLEHIDKHRKLIRVLETQHQQLRQVRQFVDMQTGVKKTIPDHWDRTRIQRVIEYMQLHNLPLAVMTGWEKRVRHTITAADILLYDDWSPYDSFTVIPYFAYFRRGVTRGMIHDLIDPQKEINKRRSVFLHFIMTMANPIWLHKKGSLSDEMIETIENEGSRPGLRVEYEGDVKPERVSGQVNAAPLQVAEKEASNDLKEISGVNGSALGQDEARVKSGVAIARQQRQTVIGAEDYFDNFSRTRELKGRKYLELAQNWYTEERLVRVRGDDGKNVDTWINQPKPEGKILNDVTLGSYSVAIDEAPLAATMDQQQFEELTTMVKELGIPVPPDIIVEASNVPRKREIIERMQPPPVPGMPPGQPTVPGAPPAAGPMDPSLAAAMSGATAA